MQGKKLVVLAVLLISLFLVLFGCSGNKEVQSGNNDGASEVNSNDKEVIELTLWNTWADEAAEAATSIKRVEDFNNSQDEINIVLEMTPHDQYKTKLKTQAAGKQLPELIQVWPGAELEPLATGGVLKSIDSIKDNWEGLIPDSVLDDYAYDGVQYAIPGNISFTSLIYYDQDMIQEAGFSEFPENYEEFKELVTNLKDEGYTPIQLGNKAQWVLQSSYISTIADRITGSDYLKDVLSGNAKFTDKEFVDSLSVIDELTKMGAFNEDMNTLDDIQSREQFFQGDAAMHIAGSWIVTPLIEGISDNKNIGVAIFPEIAGGKGDPVKVSGVSSVGIALNADLTEEQEEAAHEFLKYFYSEDQYKEWVSDGLMVAADIEVPDDVHEIVKEVISVTSNGIAPVYDGVLPPTLTSIINNGLQAITTGSMTPEQLAEEMQNELDNQ